LLGDLRLDLPYVAEPGREAAARRADRVDDPRLDRNARAPTGPVGARRSGAPHPEELPPQEVDGAPRPEAVLDRPGDDAGDERGGGRSPAGALRAVPNDRTEHCLRVRGELDERSHRVPGFHARDRGREPLRGPGHDRPEGREAALPFGEEPVRVADRPEHRTEVGTADPHVVEDQHGRPPVPAQPPQDPGQNLGGREPPSVEPLVEPLEEGGGDPVGPAQEPETDRDPAGVGRCGVRPEAVHRVPGRAAGDGRRAGTGRTGDPDDPGRGRSGDGGVEPSDHLLDFVLAGDRDRRHPIVRQDLGVRGRWHGSSIAVAYKNTVYRPHPR